MTTTVIKTSQAQTYFILKPLLGPYVMYFPTTSHILCCDQIFCLSAVTNSASWWHQST